MIQIDMPMPDSCYECRFETARGFCKAMPDNFCGYTNYERKPEWCPLKEQEPRVMTLEDVKAFDWDYCYLEEERLPGKEYRAVCGNYALTCITWPCVASMRIQHGDESYGRKWRCWTARPTEEQRRAVKWNGQQVGRTGGMQMKCNVGDWTYVKDGLPENYAGRLWVACRAKDGSRENWVACGIIYGYYRGTKNPWGIPLLDDDDYEAYAWMYEWCPKPPKEKCE